MKTNCKYFPLFLALILGAVSCFIRCVLMFLYTDTDGEYTGSKLLLYFLSILLIAALVFSVVVSRKSTKGFVARLGDSVDFFSVFVYACGGFFQAFSLLFMAYAFIKGTSFFDGDTRLSSLLLIFASLFTAVLCFIKASGKEPSLKKSPFYSLMYLFPVFWALVRLFVLFVNYSAMAIYTAEKLQVLSLVVLTVYFLYEARLYHSQKPLSLGTYSCVSILTVVLVPLSALPSFLRSLFMNESASLGQPILCLVELAMCAFAAASFANTLKNRRSTDENR